MKRFLSIIILTLCVTCVFAQRYYYYSVPRPVVRPVVVKSVRRRTVTVVRHTCVPNRVYEAHRCQNCGAELYGEDYDNASYQGAYTEQPEQCYYDEGSYQQEETCVGWTINFDINSFSIATNVDAHTNIMNVVDYAKRYPHATFNIYGYADAQTGNPTYNRNLAQKRLDLICSILINGYNISPSRINPIAYGSDQQRYRKNNYNRCVYIESIK